ncbi:MAG: hypothetical protein HYV54_01080 [Parcubacteria group bacterium]|nr:hypothetical protein [Parcubacteria group bacterium]
MAKTYTHTLIWRELKPRHDNSINLPIHLAQVTGERCMITDNQGKRIAAIVTAEDLLRLEGIESTTPAHSE